MRLGSGMVVSLRTPLGSFNRLVQAAGQPKFLALWFVLCALPTGLGCALLTPEGVFPDEAFHAVRADGLRHGEIFGQRPLPGAPEPGVYMATAGVLVDNGFLRALVSDELGDASRFRQVTVEDRRSVEALPWFPGMSYFPTQMVQYFPIMYVPGAVGLLAGQVVGLPPLYAFFLGRVVMLLAFIVLGTVAIARARFGNALIFAVLTLPTTINLASSYNQDGLIIVCCTLAAALLSRCGPGLSRDWFAALALLTAVVSAKTPYAVLLLLCLPPFMASGFWRRAVLIGLASVLPGLWLLHNLHFGFIAYQTLPYHPGPLWPGARDVTLQSFTPRNNLLVLLAHPAQIILLPLTSFAARWHWMWRLFLGGIVDRHIIGTWEYPLLAIALLAAACATLYPRPGTWRGLDAGFAAAVLFTAFICIELAMYLTWTNAGLDEIDGVNPRYFTPLVPFLIFLLRALFRCAGGILGRLPSGAEVAGWGGQHLRLSAGWLCLPAMAMAVVNVFALPAFIFHLFRMPGP